MTIALALLLSLSALQSGDRAVLVPTSSGERTEITDPAVLRLLESFMADDRAPVEKADWTVSVYQGSTLVREMRVMTAGSQQSIAHFLRSQERLRQLSKDLGNDSYDVREKATQELMTFRRVAVEPMRKLSESASDVEVRSRAAQIVRDLHAAARPRLQARFVFALRNRVASCPESIDDWIRATVASLGFPAIAATGWTAWADVALERSTLFPAVRSEKPGGIYVSGNIVDWTMDGAVTVEVTCSVKSWKSGRFTLDASEPRRLIRLSDRDSLFLALRITEER